MVEIGSLDIEQSALLAPYLEQQGIISPGERFFSRSLTGGVSNRTVLVQRPSGEEFVLKQALPQLRVEVEWFSDPSRVHREAAGIRWLEKLLPSGHVPAFLFEDFENHVLGMTAVPEPHQNWKEMLLRGEIDEEHVRQFGQLLGQLHRQASEQETAVAREFADDSFFESLRLEPYYAFTAGQIPQAAGFLNFLIAETRRQKVTLVHGDYSPKNTLIHQEKLILLDHEVIHFGDPAFDLGFSLTHLLSKAHHLPVHRAAFTQAAAFYWSSYRRRLGDLAWTDGLEERAVRHTLGCLLARVAGRSPLEYMSVAERQRQQLAVLALMRKPPATMLALIEQFLEEL